MAITAQDINKLRQATGAGMMDCKKALTETNGDFEAAIDWLRKQGQKIAAKRSDREAKEGVVFAVTNANNTVGYVVTVSCETDFVSKNEDFIAFGKSIADAAVAGDVKTVEELHETEISGTKISALIDDKLASIGEKIGIARYERLEGPYISSYIHGANRLGVLVSLSANAEEAGKDIAMQIAAMNPLGVDADSIAPEIIERERNIIIDTMKEDPKMAGKPDDMIAKIAEGKINAFFKENTLVNQTFVKDGSKSVADYLKSVSPDLKVNSFVRVALG